MQHKRFAWTCAAAGMLATMSLLGACDPEEDDKTPDTVDDAGTKPDSGVPDSGVPDSGTPDSGVPDSGVPDAGEPDAGPPDAGPTSALPVPVDTHWAPSGYMGDGESGGIVDEAVCATTRPGAGKGNCHKITYTAGSANWAGVWWQYPEGNWGANPGFEVPEGATVLSFYAWGAAGGEAVKFMVGMGAQVDGFGMELPEQILTTEPKEYTIDVSRVRYRKVVGGFGWVTGGKPTPVVFYIDDIQWR